MKYLKLASIVLILCASCTAKKVTNFENGVVKIKGCPEDGTCNVERIENSQVLLYEDTTGQFYPKVEKSQTHHTYKITYNKKVDERIMDAQYQEVIYFEIEKDEKIKELTGKALDRAKVIYGRLCRCPGETGYEYILDGNLFFEQFRESTEISIEIQPKSFPITMKKLETNVTFYD